MSFDLSFIAQNKTAGSTTTVQRLSTECFL
jgi:hypothetical protein